MPPDPAFLGRCGLAAARSQVPQGASPNWAFMRSVYCEDALAWLASRTPLAGASLVTSLPDFSEFPRLSMAEWQSWFRDAAQIVLRACPPDGVAIFYQTDIKVDGCWIDKAHLVGEAARTCGVPLLWHKIVCRVTPGTVTFGRPAYAHMLCFSPGIRVGPEHSSADVVLGGKSAWARGMGIEACRLACRFVRRHTGSRTLVAPFCGTGLVLAVAEEMGLEAVGIELSRKRARAAERQGLENL